MSSHRPHPIGGDPSDAVLYDSCIRCGQHAADPIAGLDPQNIQELWSRMLATERGIGDTTYRTMTEQRAGRDLWRVYLFLERHTTVDPTHLMDAREPLS